MASTTAAAKIANIATTTTTTDRPFLVDCMLFCTQSCVCFNIGYDLTKAKSPHNATLSAQLANIAAADDFFPRIESFRPRKSAVYRVDASRVRRE
jgi:hypothetical protein